MDPIIEGEIRKAYGFQKMAQASLMEGNTEQAKQFMALHLDAMEGIYNKYPDERLTKGLVAAYGMAAMFFEEIEDYDSLLQYSFKALALLKRLLEASPESLDYQKGLAQVMVHLGTAYSDLGQHEKSRHYLTEANNLYGQLIRLYPEDDMLRQNKKNCEMILSVSEESEEEDIFDEVKKIIDGGIFARDNGDYQRALHYFTSAAEFISESDELDESDKNGPLAFLNYSIAEIYNNDEINDTGQAEIYYQKAVDFQVRRYELRIGTEDAAKIVESLTESLSALCSIEIKKENFKAAQAYLDLVIDFYNDIRDSVQDFPRVENQLRETRENISATIEMRYMDGMFDEIFAPWIKRLDENPDEAAALRLFEKDDSLSDALANMYYAIDKIAEKSGVGVALERLEKHRFFPYPSQYVKKMVQKDLESALGFLKEVCGDESFSVLRLDMDDELLNYAESVSDDDITLAIVSLVESNVELEGVLLRDRRLLLTIERCLIEQEMSVYTHQPLVELFKSEDYGNEFLASYWASHRIDLEYGHGNEFLNKLQGRIHAIKSRAAKEKADFDSLADEFLLKWVKQRVEDDKGNPATEGKTVPPVEKSLHPSSHLLLSIIAFILCWPLGVVALYHSFKVSRYNKSGDTWVARIPSRKAKKWGVWGIVLGAMLWGIGLYYAGREICSARSALADVEAVENNIYTVNAKTLNVRAGAGTSYPVVGVLSQGDEVSVSGSDGEWLEVSRGAIRGYVHADYLTKVEGSANSSSVGLSPEMIRMSGWKANAIMGRVKTVTYSSGETLEFNADGNLVTDRRYEGPLNYTWNNDKYSILFPEKNVRYEKWDSGTAEDIGISYYFDDLGRIVSYSNSMRYTVDTKQYEYEDKRSVLPSSMTVEDADEVGSWKTTYTYTYLDVDKAGNWTKRKVGKKFEEENYETGESKVEEEPSFVETAKYIYFE